MYTFECDSEHRSVADYWSGKFMESIEWFVEIITIVVITINAILVWTIKPKTVENR